MSIAITILTSRECKLCEQAKLVLDRVAENYDIRVEPVSVESPLGKELVIEHRVAFTPGIIIQGKTFSYGRLSERKLRRELDRIVELNLQLPSESM